jgi:D-alanyl-D-alanine carboxypeptidase
MGPVRARLKTARLSAVTISRQQLADAAAIAERLIRYRATMTNTPGVSYGLSHGGEQVLLGAFGSADLGAGVASTATTAYRIASISKTFAATLVMQLVERGRLRLDEPVTTYLPWTRPVLGGSGVTLRHLLTHSAGMIRDGACDWSPEGFPDRRRLHAEVLGRGMVAEAAGGFRYSNVAYAMVGEIVEKAAGVTFADAVTRRIARPLGLGSTTARLTARARRALAVGYGHARPGEPFVALEHSEAAAFQAAGGLISNVPDLLAYQAAHLAGDTRLVSDLAKREMQRVQWQRSEQPHHGLGWMVYDIGDISVRGHSGGYPGFVTRIAFAPDLGVASAVLTNSVGNLAAVGVDLIYHAIGRVRALWQEAGTTVDGGPTRRELGRCAGQYRGGFGEITVGLVNRSLYLIDPDDEQPMRIPARLAPLGDSRFLVADNADYGYRGEEVRFELGKAGDATALIYGAARHVRADL